MLNKVMHMFEQFLRIGGPYHLGFFSVEFALVLVLAVTIVYVWNKIIEMVEKNAARI